MTEQTKQAIAFIQQSLNDFANTLPLSARGPFIRDASQALQTIDTELSKPVEVKE